MRKWHLLVAGALFGVTLVSAAIGAGYGLGMKTCAQFAQAYSANPKLAEELYFSWAQGLISGMNLAAEADNKTTRALSVSGWDEQKARIREYCNTRPLETYGAAVIDLFNNMPAAKR